MSNTSAFAEPRPPKEDPETLALRGKPRPAVRFRRGLIVSTTAAVAAGLVTVSWLAIQPPSFRPAAEPVDDGDLGSRSGADALSGLPRNYGDVPRLGPPLPGDLGGPILEQERSVDDTVSQAASDAAAAKAARAREIDEQRQQAAAAREAARSAPLAVQLGEVATADASAAPTPPPPHGERSEAQGDASIGQQDKLAFAAAAADADVNPHRLVPSPSPWTLSAGTVIAASLLTGLDSDLPGTVLAEVSENVRDSVTGRTVLIPQGARLIGKYDSGVSYGQRRASLVWTRVVLPDGSSVRLDKMPASDAAGYSGLADKVDSHGWALFKGVLLSTLLGVGTELGLGARESGLVRAIRESAQQNAAHAGDQLTARNLEVQPTIKVRPGWPVRVIVNQDLVLQPWRG